MKSYEKQIGAFKNEADASLADKTEKAAASTSQPVKAPEAAASSIARPQPVSAPLFKKTRVERLPEENACLILPDVEVDPARAAEEITQSGGKTAGTPGDGPKEEANHPGTLASELYPTGGESEVSEAIVEATTETTASEGSPAEASRDDSMPGWSELDPHLVGDLPERSLPGDVFSPEIAAFISAVAAAIGVSEGYVAATVLAMMAAAVGNARVGAVSHEWTVPCIVWFLLLGTPGSRKSPAMNRVVKLYRALEKEAQREHAAADTAHMTSEEAAWREAAGEDRQPGPRARAEPAPRFICESTTFAGMIDLVVQQARGLLMVADEIAGVLKSASPELRALLLKSFDADPFCRVTARAEIDIDRVSLSAIGCIQPDVLEQISGAFEQDGLAARFLPVTGGACGRSDLTARIEDGAMLEILRRLRALEPDVGPHGLEPRKVPFTDAARDLIAARMTESRQACERGVLAGIVSKSDGIVARIALVLALSRVVSAGPETPETVEAEDVRAAGRLFDDYLLPMARSAYWLQSCSEIERAARKMVMKLREKPRAVISVRNLRRMAPADFNKDDTFADLLAWLGEAGVLRLLPLAPSGPRGGAPSRQALVNPRIWPPGQAPEP